MSLAIPPLTCRHCAAALAPQQRNGGHCGAAGCRHRESLAQGSRLAQRLGEPALQAAQPKLQGRRATLLWLREAETKLVPVSKSARAAHRAHLMALVNEQPADDAAQPLAEASPSTARGEQEGRLCGQCRGYCCAHGGQTHAFITRPQLLRWQLRESGRTLQGAVDWYMAQVPQRHTRRACIYQGPQGCVLPREDRADICNSYACDSLVQMHEELLDDREAAFVAVTPSGGALVRRALIDASATQPL